MSTEDRVRWDGIFKKWVTQPYPQPDPFLLQFTPIVPADEKRRALDLCSGLGQNGVWLAEQGYSADLMDISRVGLQRASQEVTARNVRNINLLRIDVDFLQLENETYNLICVFRYLRRSLFPVIQRGVKRGGRVIYETFNKHYLRLVPEFNPEFLLETGELKSYFEGWQILHEEELDHHSRIVAIKP